MNIDIEKSIKTKHLKFRTLSFSQRVDSVFDALVPVMLVLVGVILPILMTVQGIRESRPIAIFPLVIYSPFILIGLLSLHALINGNRLIRFKGINEAFNHKTMFGILEQRFKIPIDRVGGGTVVINKEASFWRFGTRITVIFRGSDVFINIARFNYRGLRSPFHPFIDSFEIRSIIKEFRSKTKTTP